MYSYFTDPAHGWIKVMRREVDALGVGDKISSCSYQRGDHVYLEEDGDAPRFIAAWETLFGVDFETKVRHHRANSPSRIRNYESYEPTIPALKGFIR